MLIAWWTLQIIYILIIILISIRIIYDTQNITKTLAYLLLVVFVPILGIVFYLSFGINYRKRKMYTKKLYNDESLSKKLENQVLNFSNSTYLNQKQRLKEHKKLINLITNDTLSSISDTNHVELLINGEVMFPKAIDALKRAKHHIHIEYYIFEDDKIGNQIVDILCEKAREGVDVRFIYDDYGSRAVRGKMLKRLKEAGVKAFPFHRVIFIYLANRLNFRNHRKIIIVDGKEAFVGGINVSDKYINSSNSSQMYWRDTHLKIKGQAVFFLQHIFMCDWNFCANDELTPSDDFFPALEDFLVKGDKIVQIVGSGPDSEIPTILYSLLQAINLAKEEILITTPYFIPSESIVDALIIAALGGVKVKLLIPGVSDSKLVNAAARSFYNDLIKVGVEIYIYQKGFVHAKTMVVDNKIAVVGTANMDYRSFDLNFEVNAIVYDEEIASELSEAFYEDLNYSDYIEPVRWLGRSKYIKLKERAARLVSPLL